MWKVLAGLIAGVALAGSVPPTAAMAQKAKPSNAAQTSTTPAAAGTPARATGSFATEGAAKAHCPSDTVMWGNSETKVLHYAGTKLYGKTRHGGYMCESEATKTGFHVAKGEKHS